MKTTLESLKDNKVKLTITMDASEVDAAINAAYKEAASKYRFPGFRPGKAPRKVVESALGGPEVILGDATEALINDSFPKALGKEDIRPVGPTSFGAVPEGEDGKIPPVAEGKEFAYSAEFEIRPSFELSSIEDLAIEMPPTHATDAEIARQLEMIREQYASLEPADDRPVQKDDFALISFVGDVDGEPYEGNTVDKYLYEMNHGNMPPEFDEGLVGMKPGDEKRIEFDIPSGNENEEFEGKKAGFDVTLHEIKTKVLPDLDDEFATIAGLENLDQLKEEVANQIQSQKLQMAGRIKEQRSAAMLAERLQGEAPDVLLDEKVDELLKDFYRTLQQQQIDPGDYMAQNDLTVDKLREEMRDQATKIVKEELALEALFRAKDMEITDADIDDEFRGAAGEKGDPAKLRAEWEAAGLMPMLREGVRRVKAIRWLMDNVKIIEVDPSKDAKKKEDKGEKKSAKKSTSKKAASKGSEKKESAKKAPAKKDAEKKAPEDEK